MARSFPETLRALNGEAPILPRWVFYLALALALLWGIWLITPGLPETYRTGAVGGFEASAEAGGWLGWGRGLDGEADGGNGGDRTVEVEALFAPQVRDAIVPGQRAFIAVRNREGDREGLTGEVRSGLRANGATMLAFTVPGSVIGWSPVEAAVEAGRRTPLAWALGSEGDGRNLVIETEGAYRPAFEVHVRRFGREEAAAPLRLGVDAGDLPLLLSWREPRTFSADFSGSTAGFDLVAIGPDGRIAELRGGVDPLADPFVEEDRRIEALLLLPPNGAGENGLSVGDIVWNEAVAVNLEPAEAQR